VASASISGAGGLRDDEERRDDPDLDDLGANEDEEAMMRDMEDEEESVVVRVDPVQLDVDEELLLSLRDDYFKECFEGPDEDEEAMMRDMEIEECELRPPPGEPSPPPGTPPRVDVPPAPPARVLTRNIVYKEAL